MTAAAPWNWIPGEFAELADVKAHYLRPVVPDTWRDAMYLVPPYTWYAREDTYGLNVLPIREGHTPPPDAVALPPSLHDIALTHYNLSPRFFQQTNHPALYPGTKYIHWTRLLERFIRETLAGRDPTPSDKPTPEETARRASVTAFVDAQRAAYAAEEADRIRRSTVMYVTVEEDNTITPLGTWNDLHYYSTFSPAYLRTLKTAEDLPAGITNDQLRRYDTVLRRIDEITEEDELYRQHLANETADGVPDGDGDDIHPDLVALIKERDTLSAHFAAVLSGHERRKHALLVWGATHCGWDVA